MSGAGRSGSVARLIGLVIGASLLFAMFLALGAWQVQRRAWKLELMAAVAARVHAPPEPAPGPAAWPSITAASDTYRHVRLNGRFLNSRETLVQAVSDYGAGAWVMTPLRTDAGFVVLVNRGFTPPDHKDPATRSAGEIEGETEVRGLLRLTEPGGGFLQANAAGRDRWYSRDVAAILRARGLGRGAPYFVDADATPNAGGLPIGGLTVIRFANSHLVYAITWFTLAGLVLAGSAVVLRRERRFR